MQKFSYYGPEDYDAGVYLNSRRSLLQSTSLSPYTVARVQPDSAQQPSISTYFGSVPVSQPNPWTFISGRDYETTTPYAAYQIPASVTLGAYDIDIVYDTGLANVFAKQYVDTQNIQNIDTYYPQDSSGVFARQHIMLNGVVGQNITLYHSGFNNKNAKNALGPINYIGQSIAPGTTITANASTPILNEQWIITAGATFWTLTRQSTATVTPYGYNIPLKNIIPGFTVFVNNGNIAVNDAASLATYPGKLDLLYYTLYTSLAPVGKWVSPIMDTGDANSKWMFAKYQNANKSNSAYLENINVGQTATPDATWIKYIPATVSAQDFVATQSSNAYRQSVVSLGNLNGRYAQGQFTISSYSDFIQAVEFYAWNPITDPVMRLQGPVVQGPHMQQFMAAFAMAMTDWQIRYNRFLESFAISTSEREYLFQKGQLLNTPIHIGEALLSYRQRLELVAQGMTQAGTLAYMQQAVQAYTGTNQAYIKELAHGNLNWKLGLSQLGLSAYLGQAAVGVWSYEVHVPGAGNYDPDGLIKFIYYLNPVGAVPVFIFE